MTDREFGDDATNSPSPRLRQVLAALVPVVCPPDATSLGLTADIVDHVSVQIASLSRLFRVALEVGGSAFDVAAVAWPPARGRTFSRLPPPLAERWFLRWLHSPLLPQRQLAKGLRQLLCLAHFEMPAIQARLGYGPDAWIEKVQRKRLMTYADDIRRHQEALVAPDPLPHGGFVRNSGQAGAKEAV